MYVSQHIKLPIEQQTGPEQKQQLDCFELYTFLTENYTDFCRHKLFILGQN